jgi:hypothetical protein
MRVLQFANAGQPCEVFASGALTDPLHGGRIATQGCAPVGAQSSDTRSCRQNLPKPSLALMSAAGRHPNSLLTAAGKERKSAKGH